VDQATLVNLDVNAGLKVLDALDAAQIKVAVALWMVTPDYDDWRLVLSSPSLDQTHPLKAYEKVAEALHDRFAYMRPPILIYCRPKIPLYENCAEFLANPKT
jgi:hypothetical protein